MAMAVSALKSKEVERIDSEIKQLDNDIAALSFAEEENTQHEAHINMLVQSLAESVLIP